MSSASAPPNLHRPVRLGGATLLALSLVAAACSDSPSEGDRKSFSEYLGSAACESCHSEQFQDWNASVHRKAERLIDAASDESAFVPHRQVRIENMEWKIRGENNRFTLSTLGADGKAGTFQPVRVLGETPLRQFLVPSQGGRIQVTSLAFDPTKQEWFDVFGAENRRPDEWGYWANRGMTWNSMCAECHNTALRKNYDLEKDHYTTRMAERGVGCEACHGPGKAHVRWRQRSPLRQWGPWGEDPIAVPRDQKLVDTCAPCHARRTLLSEEFLPGDNFLDHYVPELPSYSATYYPDGQVRDEDYVYSSFLMSRMYNEGVDCMDCHNPHSATPRMEGNGLCLQCHAKNINPAEHMHHQAGKPGGLCVDCHMPVTVYMQRQPRRDHSFSIPDPALTIEAAVPNACNRCHTDQTPEWAAQAAREWFGTGKGLGKGSGEMRYSGKRARVFAQVRRQDENAPIGPEAVRELIQVALKDKNAAWRAAAVGMLGPWIFVPEARGAAVRLLKDPHPLVRTLAVGSLEASGQETLALTEPLLEDPVRSVRVRTAWVLRAGLDSKNPALAELTDYLTLTAGQPPGALLLSTLWRDRGEVGKSVQLLRRALAWDPYAERLWETLAISLMQSRQTEEAVATLKDACRRLPNSATLRQSLGLVLAETKDLPGAIRELQKACALDPRHPRAWYNLGLALHQQGRSAEAVEALHRAAGLDPSGTDYPFTLACVFRDIGQFEEAKKLARATLRLDARHQGAQQLLISLGTSPSR